MEKHRGAGRAVKGAKSWNEVGIYQMFVAGWEKFLGFLAVL